MWSGARVVLGVVLVWVELLAMVVTLFNGVL